MSLYQCVSKVDGAEFAQVKELNTINSLAGKVAGTEYLATKGTNGGFLLTHSVGNIHTGEDVNNALNYADYYFLEALLRWKNIKK